MTPSPPASVVSESSAPLDSEPRIVAAVDAPWADVLTVFGRRGDPAHCFCQFFKVSNADWKAQDDATRSSALCKQIDDARTAERLHGAGPGLLAYLDDEPVGWCAVEPRQEYPRVLSSTVAASSHDPIDVDDHRVWAISCFVVRTGFRRRGVSRALLTGAVEHARRHGARVVEGYPVDPSGAKKSAAELYHGILPAFVDAGFEVVARPSERRAVVSLTL